MAAKTYCLASAKGGSGKTMICASFAAFLAGIGKRVLMIDVDLATHGLTLLYLNEVNQHRENCTSEGPCGLFDRGGWSAERDIVHLPNQVDFIPATFHFGFECVGDMDIPPDDLMWWIDAAKSGYDYVFLDAQAGTDIYSRLAMSRIASDEVVIVSEYDPLSAAGVERLKGIMRDELVYSRTWVLINKILPEFAATSGDFLEISRYLTPIPWDADVVRAYARRQLPIDLEYGNQFTLAVMQTLKVLLGKDISAQIDLWAESQASSIRTPIEEQYEDAEAELANLLRLRAASAEKDTRFRNRRLVRTFLLTAYSGIVAFFVLSRYDMSTRIAAAATTSAMTTAAVAVLLTFLGNTGRGSRLAEKELEDARLRRQLTVLEDKLKRLEVLRQADLRTLVEERRPA